MFKSFFCYGVRLRTKSIITFRIVCFSYVKQQKMPGVVGAFVFFANVCQQAAKDHRFSKPTSQKPTPPEPKRENIRMVEQEESFYTPPRGRSII